MMISDADFGWAAWQGFIDRAYQDDNAKAQFTADTGMPWPVAPRSGLDIMIDKVTGYSGKHAEAFVLWASEQYGIEYCPPAIREAVAAKKASA